MQVQIIRPDGRIVVGPGGEVTAGPRTRGELDALVFRRGELSNQVERLRGERGDLLRAIKDVGDGPSRPAYQLRMAEVDERIIRLERQIDAVNDQIASAPAQVMTTTAPPRNPIVDEMADKLVPLAGMFSVFFLFPLALAFARLLWKRGTNIAERPSGNEQLMMNRLEQLQASVDTMALEVERISEGQRYVARVMSEKDKAALPR